MTMPNALSRRAPRLLLAVAVPLAGFVLVPALFRDRETVLQSLLLRGALAGSLAGLLASDGTLSPLEAAAAAVAASLAGLLLMLRYAPFQALTWGAALLLAALVALLLAEAGRRLPRRVGGAMVLGALCVAFLWQAGATPGVYAPWAAGIRRIVATEPAAESYSGDAWIYLKTHYLVDRGVPYYEAFGQAYLQDARFDHEPLGRLNYRQPWLFELWRLLPGPEGLGLWYGYIAFCILSMVAAYALAVRFVEPAVALLGPVALFAYGAFHADFLQLTFMELWAAPVALVALALMVRKRWLAAAVAVLVAVSFRETMLYLVPVFALAWWLGGADRRRHVVAAVVGVLGPIAVLGVHWLRAPAGVAAPTAWYNGGTEMFLRSIRYSVDLMPYGEWLAPLAVIAALTGIALLPGRSRAALAVAVLLPLAFVFSFSPGEGGQYWGGIVMPVVWALAPVALVRMAPADPGEGARAAAATEADADAA